MNKAQFSVDLLMVIGIMLLLFLALFQFYLSKSQDVRLVSEKLKGKEIADSVSEKVNLALLGGNGTEIKYNLPGNILDKDYDVSISGRRVEVGMQGFVVSSPILTSNIETPDLNSKKGQEMVFVNLDGKIIVK
ncbi:MAG: hypothetical protein ABIG96_03125 [Candidatus Micrarchaeota archaeon]